ncbi:MAG: hypothetical protein KAU48_11940, partial [Candidatus Thorarchaeota archaeon]|nr:hypothetical protein [Candidatus Thorarchaeota archaeon]
KNKLFKGLTEHDVLTWEEEKMRYQRKMGRKVTDLEFLRYLMMKASRPVITTKEGVASGFLTGQGAIYEKGETLLERYRSQAKNVDPPAEMIQQSKPAPAKRLLENP